MPKRRMHFITLMCAGPTNHNNGGWRHPDGDGHLVLDPARYEEIARISERGLFDGIFLVDYQFTQGQREGVANPVVRYGGQMVMLDPMQLLATMARVTSHIGLAATLSTSFHHAYHLARVFASLDHISKGRAGWNVVTSGNPAEARNFGMDALDERVNRYDHADEVLEACMALWDTWQADALILDKQQRPVRRSGQGPVRPLRGEVGAYRGRPHHPAPAAGPSGADAGRLEPARHGFRRALGRGDLHRPAGPGADARVLCRHEGAGRRPRPRAGALRRAARARRHRRGDRGAGAGPGGLRRQPRQRRTRPADAVRPHRHRLARVPARCGFRRGAGRAGTHRLGRAVRERLRHPARGQAAHHRRGGAALRLDLDGRAHRRHAGADRRSHAGDLRGGLLRRLRHRHLDHADGAGQFRRSGGARTAAPRALSHANTKGVRFARTCVRDSLRRSWRTERCKTCPGS